MKIVLGLRSIFAGEFVMCLLLYALDANCLEIMPWSSVIEEVLNE